MHGTELERSCLALDLTWLIAILTLLPLLGSFRIDLYHISLELRGWEGLFQEQIDGKNWEIGGRRLLTGQTVPGDPQRNLREINIPMLGEMYGLDLDNGTGAAPALCTASLQYQS